MVVVVAAKMTSSFSFYSEDPLPAHATKTTLRKKHDADVDCSLYVCRVSYPEKRCRPGAFDDVAVVVVLVPDLPFSWFDVVACCVCSRVLCA